MDLVPTQTERFNTYMNTYNSKTEEDIKLAYRKWAPFYEWHIVDMGWDAPRLCAELLCNNMPTANITPAIKVLDVACGTGLVGAELRTLVYGKNIVLHGIDLSNEMLAECSKKSCYDKLWDMNAERMCSLEDCTYDGIICVGALNFGHIPPTAFNEFIRVTKPGGNICFSTRADFYQTSSKEIQNQLTLIGAWLLLEKRHYTGEAVKDMEHIHWCYRKI